MASLDAYDAINDYSMAILLDPDNSDYYRLRSLAHFLNHSSKECKLDKEKAKSIDQMFDELEIDGYDNYYQKTISERDWWCQMPIKGGSLTLSGKNDDIFFARLAPKSYIEVLQSFLPFLENRGR